MTTHTTPEGYTAVCAWCNPQRWIDSNGNRARKPSLIEAIDPDVSHGMCRACHSEAIKFLDHAKALANAELDKLND